MGVARAHGLAIPGLELRADCCPHVGGRTRRFETVQCVARELFGLVSSPSLAGSFWGCRVCHPYLYAVC